MNALSALWAFWSDKGTRILGVATGTLVTLTGTGIIPDSHLKYWMAAIAVLTYWRGQSNANALSNSLPPPQPQAQVKTP